MRAASLLAGLLTFACAAEGLAGQEETRKEPVRFAPGASSATIQGVITGREAVDYLLGASAGQTMTVTLATDHPASYFNVIPPDAENEAVFIGSTGGLRFEGLLDLSGDWKIRVYLVRAAARRGETAAYSLTVGITGQPDPGAAREANDFGPREWDARGSLGCARGGAPMRASGCPFKVIRYRGGGTVFVLAPGTGTERILYFDPGVWSTDSADPVQAVQSADTWYLVVGDEAYEVPEAVVLGG
jgi:hypothetical protein